MEWAISKFIQEKNARGKVKEQKKIIKWCKEREALLHASFNASNKYLLCRLVINVISPQFQSVTGRLRCISNNCIHGTECTKEKEDLKDYYRNLPFPCDFLIFFYTLYTKSKYSMHNSDMMIFIALPFVCVCKFFFIIFNIFKFNTVIVVLLGNYLTIFFCNSTTTTTP